MPFVDTAASNSFLSNQSLLESTTSENAAPGMFVTREIENIFCERSQDDYKVFRRNMRVAFNLEDLTSSEESGNESADEGWSDAGNGEYEGLELVDGDSFASARRRLNEGYCGTVYAEDEQECSADDRHGTRLFTS